MIANKCVICRPLLCLLRCWWFCCRHRFAQKFNVVVNGDKSFTLRFILQCYRILCKCYHGNHLVATSKCSVEMDKFSILQFHNFLRNTITFWNDFSYAYVGTTCNPMATTKLRAHEWTKLTSMAELLNSRVNRLATYYKTNENVQKLHSLMHWYGCCWCSFVTPKK